MKDFIRRAAAVLLTIPLLLLLVPDIHVKTLAAVSACYPLDEQYKSVTQGFDPNRNVNDVSGYHNAVDIVADYCANIYAVYPGECISAGWMNDYGYMVILHHADLGVYTFYAHCTSTAVSAGATVSAGQVIGYVGSTGSSTTNHLHFGICENLVGNYPAKLYYDPMTYFDYIGYPEPPTEVTTTVPVTTTTAQVTTTAATSAVSTTSTKKSTSSTETTTTAATTTTAVTTSVSTPSGDTCSCSDSYAGQYTTKGVTSFLHIRKGHGSDFDSVGQIPPNAVFTVTKGDGKWAHVEYNGISGYCAMNYMQRVTQDEPVGMTLTEASLPSFSFKKGSVFSVTGKVHCDKKIARIWGGVFKAWTNNSVIYVEDTPNLTDYSLTWKFDAQLTFDRLAEGAYSYKYMALDSDGTYYELLDVPFIVTSGTAKLCDLNNDNGITVADAIVLQTYLVKGGKLTENQYLQADLNKDQRVDVYDMVLMRKAMLT